MYMLWALVFERTQTRLTKKQAHDVYIDHLKCPVHAYDLHTSKTTYMHISFLTLYQKLKLPVNIKCHNVYYIILYYYNYTLYIIIIIIIMEHTKQELKLTVEYEPSPMILSKLKSSLFFFAIYQHMIIQLV